MRIHARDRAARHRAAVPAGGEPRRRRAVWVMDQMTCVFGEPDALMARLCQPAELQSPVPIPVGAGVAASITFMLGNAVVSRSRFLGLAMTAYLAWVAWGVVSHGFPSLVGTLTSENKSDLATIYMCIGFIVGAGISVYRNLSGASLTVDDLGSDALEIRNQHRAARVFNAARNTYDQFCATHPVDSLDITEQETAIARQEPSLQLVERHLLNVASWCRRQQTPGLTASVLDQLGALYLRQGRLDDARRCLEEAGDIFHSPRFVDEI